MTSIVRRDMLRASATALAAGLSGAPLLAAADDKPAQPPGAAPKGPPPEPVTDRKSVV